MAELKMAYVCHSPEYNRELQVHNIRKFVTTGVFRLLDHRVQVIIQYIS